MTDPAVHRQTFRFVLVLVLLLLVAGGSRGATRDGHRASETAAGLALDASDPIVVRVYYDDLADVKRLTRFDLWEYNNQRERYVLVMLDRSRFAELRALGLRTQIDAEWTREVHRVHERLPGQRAGISGFPCYRTVDETYAAAQQIVADHPNLATWVDAGDSWEKSAGLGGRDLLFLRMTNAALTPPSPKPKLILTCAIHAREYTPAELCTRFAEYLVDGYGSDADATWLLDHHEIHLLLLANPDGRPHAEGGDLWRKNTNQNYCSPTSSDRGADLNRNFEIEWAAHGGSSSDPCHDLYHGPSAASEPEVQTVQAYLRQEFPDQRPEPFDDPAPADATGVYLDVHSHSEVIIWPWGFAGEAPNHAELQTLGRKLAFFNYYVAKQAHALYPTDGISIDFAYGELGVAAYTYELGTKFFQSCSDFENTILPDNLPSLLYAAKVARTPYITPAGPDATGPLVAPALAGGGEIVIVTATIDDTRYSRRAGLEPVENVAGAEFYVDVPPWDETATPVALAMGAVDGAFDSSSEGVIASLDTAGMAPGKHLLFVRGRDAAGHWGAVSARFLFIANGSEGTVTGTVTDDPSGLPLVATITVDSLGPSAQSDPAAGGYAIPLPAGSWTLRVRAPGHFEQVVEDVSVSAGGSTPLDFSLEPAPATLLVDDDDDDPDVRKEYTDALDDLGAPYFVWDTDNNDYEPTATFLDSFDTVVWFAGHEHDGAAGPGGAGGAALASWLDSGRCFLISGQDYYYDRGLTDFMQDYLGVNGVTDDVEHVTVTGTGSVFGGLGPFQLDFSYSNYTDAIAPDGTAEVAFLGSEGVAAVDKNTDYYRTSYWGFGLDNLSQRGDREDVLGAFIEWCAGLPLADGDEDGVTNAADCAPLNADAWATPSPARDLRLSAGLTENLAWTAPASPGGTATMYDVLRSSDASDFSRATCVATATETTSATDGSQPGPGDLLCYLVRARNACGTSIDDDSSGAPRDAAICY